MTGAEVSPPRRRAVRAGAHGRSTGDRRTTRERLLAAAVRLLQTEGSGALSTTRLTQEVGIVQSGFYIHFPSVDACLAEAAALVVAEIRPPVRAWMEELRREDLADAGGGPDGARERLVAHFARVLDILVPRWPFLDVVERYRRSPGPVGAAMTDLYAEIVADVRGYLDALWEQAGVPPAAERARVDLYAVLIVELVVTAAGVLAGGAGPDRTATAQALAVTASTLVSAGLEQAPPR